MADRKVVACLKALQRNQIGTSRPRSQTASAKVSVSAGMVRLHSAPNVASGVPSAPEHDVGTGCALSGMSCSVRLKIVRSLFAVTGFTRRVRNV